MFQLKQMIPSAGPCRVRDYHNRMVANLTAVADQLGSAAAPPNLPGKLNFVRRMRGLPDKPELAQKAAQLAAAEAQSAAAAAAAAAQTGKAKAAGGKKRTAEQAGAGAPPAEKKQRATPPKAPAPQPLQAKPPAPAQLGPYPPPVLLTVRAADQPLSRRSELSEAYRTSCREARARSQHSGRAAPRSS